MRRVGAGVNVIDYHGVELATFNHLYNLTHLNERCVELAVARHWLDTSALGPWWLDNGLEVGNVLGHYWRCHHHVFDLNERPAWYQEMAGQIVESVDVLDARGQFPWVVSLSTVEHTADPVGALLALHKLVAPGGRLLVSFPLGAHVELDRAPGLFDWTRAAAYCRVEGGAAPEWVSCRPASGPLREQGWPTVVFIAEWEAPCES